MRRQHTLQDTRVCVKLHCWVRRIGGGTGGTVEPKEVLGVAAVVQGLGDCLHGRVEGGEDG